MNIKYYYFYLKEVALLTLFPHLTLAPSFISALTQLLTTQNCPSVHNLWLKDSLAS